MTIYSEWPLTLDATYRVRHLATVGELVQEHPLTNNGDCMVGSWRMTPEQRAALASDPELSEVTFYDEYPPGW